MIIDTTKPFNEQTEDVQEKIRSLLQNKMQEMYPDYPNFDDDGGITITMQYTDGAGNIFQLTEKRVQNKPNSAEDRSVKSKTYNIEKL